mgnify:FL=1
MQIITEKEQLKNYIIQNSIAPVNWFYRYCQTECPETPIQEIEPDLFNRFFLYWLPKESKGINRGKTQALMQQIQLLCQSIYSQTGKNLPAIYEPIYLELGEELPRIIQMKYDLSRFVGYPIIDTDPLIIDLISYKKQQARKKDSTQGMIFEQGYFEVIDKVDQYGIILRKKWSQERYIKILIDSSIRQQFRKQDILHMRLRRKLFFTTWEIEEIRGCYLPQAQRYFPSKI